MTDETKKLFDAPWEASYDGEAEMLEVYDADHDRVCIIDDFADAKHAERLARLPELYDMLLRAVRTSCDNCIYEHCGLLVDCEQLLYQDCTYEDSKSCLWNEARELLKKVRDGK